ncbi:MAG: hypothetical protein OXI74_16315 [Rhodospirillaceae bacterium]|nr:hypothetical protein [Rhodospirillaceae bacterium]
MVCMGLFDDREPRRVRVHFHLDRDQADDLRRIAQAAGKGVTLAQVGRTVVREGIAAVREIMDREQAEAVQ